MFKKFLLVILALLLTACSNNPTDTKIEKDYIDPVNDVFLFDLLDDDLKNKTKIANGNKDLNNYQLKMIGKNIYEATLTDINGNDICLTDYNQVILEVVSSDCSHCKKLISEHLDDLEEMNIKIVQYFNVGSIDEIYDFYKEIDVDVPEDISIVCHDDGLYNHLKNEYKLEAYPSIICFNDKKVSFVSYGDMDDDSFAYLYDLGFKDVIDVSDIVVKARDLSDVRDDFNEDNLNKLSSIDNDNKTVDYTLKVVGTKLDYNNISNKISSVYINEISNFSEYQDKDVVLIYTYFRNSSETDKVNFINELIKDDENHDYIVVLIEGLESSSDAYRNMNMKLNCKVVSILGYCPDDFYKLGISNYPTALFVEKGTFTGAYSNIDSVDNFKIALDLFFGDNCISLKENN